LAQDVGWHAACECANQRAVQLRSASLGVDG